MTREQVFRAHAQAAGGDLSTLEIKGETATFATHDGQRVTLRSRGKRGVSVERSPAPSGSSHPESARGARFRVPADPGSSQGRADRDALASLLDESNAAASRRAVALLLELWRKDRLDLGG